MKPFRISSGVRMPVFVETPYPLILLRRLQRAYGVLNFILLAFIVVAGYLLWGALPWREYSLAASLALAAASLLGALCFFPLTGRIKKQIRSFAATEERLMRVIAETQEARHRAETDSRLCNRAIAAAVHDLRGDLNLILGYARMLEDRDTCGEERNCCGKLIEKHGGLMVARLDELAGAEPDSESLRRHAPERETPPSAGGSSLGVLVVDDCPESRELYARFLRGPGLKVTVAESAEEALVLAAGTRFDAVLMDIGLPGLDGRAAAAKMRHDGYDGTLIGVSGDEAPESAGFDAWIRKPVTGRRLLGELEALLDIKPASAVPAAPADSSD